MTVQFIRVNETEFKLCFGALDLGYINIFRRLLQQKAGGYAMDNLKVHHYQNILPIDQLWNRIRAVPIQGPGTYSICVQTTSNKKLTMADCTVDQGSTPINKSYLTIPLTNMVNNDIVDISFESVACNLPEFNNYHVSTNHNDNELNIELLSADFTEELLRNKIVSVKKEIVRELESLK